VVKQIEMKKCCIAPAAAYRSYLKGKSRSACCSENCEKLRNVVCVIMLQAGLVQLRKRFFFDVKTQGQLLFSFYSRDSSQM